MKKFHAVFFTDLTALTWHMKSLGPYRLASELRSNGYDVLVVDYFSKFFLDPKNFYFFLKKIISEKTLFVAYSSSFFSKKPVLENVTGYEQWYGSGTGQTASNHKWPVSTEKIRVFNTIIKKLNPSCQIFYGGVKSYPITEELINSGVDFVIHGYADRLIVELAQTLLHKKHIDNFTLDCGVKVLQDDNKFFNFQNCSTHFHPSDFVKQDEILPLETSRGCLFNCHFCDYPERGRKKDSPSYMKNKDVLGNEIRENFEKYGVKKYTITDDTFNESTEKLEIFYEALKDNNLEIEFSCYLRLDLLARNPEQIVLLKKMGCTSVFLGIETLNERAAKSIGKGPMVGMVKDTLAKMHDEWGQDTSIFGSFISGLPYENKHTIDEWMQWVYDNKKLIHNYKLQTLVLSKSVSSGTHQPSDMSVHPEKYGYYFNDENDQHSWTNNLGMSRKEATAVEKYWMDKAWNNDRWHVAGWEALGLQNLGYNLNFLKSVSINKLPFDDFASKYMSSFEKYKKFLFDYCGMQV